MAFDLDDIRSKYPFLTLIKVAKEEHLGIVQNCDQRLISMYNCAVMSPEVKALFLEYGKTWWWESNRKLPINIFIGNDFEMFRRFLMSFAIKETEIVFGPTVQLSDLTQSKRIRRKTVQLVRRVN